MNKSNTNMVDFKYYTSRKHFFNLFFRNIVKSNLIIISLTKLNGFESSALRIPAKFLRFLYPGFKIFGVGAGVVYTTALDNVSTELDFLKNFLATPKWNSNCILTSLRVGEHIFIMTSEDFDLMVHSATIPGIHSIISWDLLPF